MSDILYIIYNLSLFDSSFPYIWFHLNILETLNYELKYFRGL